MKKIAIIAAALSTTVATTAFADGHTGCNDMLTSAIGLRLDVQGVDTSKVCDLSLADLTLIKSILDEDGMGGISRIKQILDR